VQAVREAARRPLGEVLSAPGGPAGFRFEAARDGWLGRSRVQVRRGIVHSLRRTEQGFEVSVGATAGGSERLDPVLLEPAPQEVVLASGGVAGGGIQFLAGSGAGLRSFSLSLAVSARDGAALPLRLAGREVTLESGVLGADLQSLGRGALERVGVLADEAQRTAIPGLYASGDVVADRPRTALEAIYSGIAAARGVCRLSASQIPVTV
jgi:glycerol-3-phosphate dehydrogenase subunit B